jgi:D-alanine-D-alanine ligase-like ATP-grasp enzyme
MSKGTILAIKDLTNSVQTSLYDLFNKAYVPIGKKHYCRIAVGATSNPQCYVNS